MAQACLGSSAELTSGEIRSSITLILTFRRPRAVGLACLRSAQRGLRTPNCFFCNLSCAANNVLIWVKDVSVSQNPRNHAKTALNNGRSISGMGPDCVKT